MKRISDVESEIGNFLNDKRNSAYIDIYKETDFSGKGIIVLENLEVYKYSWSISFGSGNFKKIYDLSLYDKKVNYEDLEKYLLDELNIVENDYPNSDDEMNRYMEVIKLKGFEKEFENSYLYDKIEDIINEMEEEEK